jgi:two-component system, chemotaxis family, protein-glutamate methylesterase/glutaminase
MKASRVVVMGGSAGGVESVIEIARGLPADFPAAVLIVIHIPSEGPSALARLVDRAGPLPARVPSDRETLTPGTIYVAPPNRHLVIEDSKAVLGEGPRENRHRPAIDPLFRSAAQSYREAVIGVLLSGNLDDGVAGLIEIKQNGGIAIVVDPADAQYSGMPRSALDAVPRIDHIVQLKTIAPLLMRIVHMKPYAIPVPSGNGGGSDPESAEEGVPVSEKPNTIPSPFSCPDCGGVLWELQEGELVQYRCRTGHRFSPESLLSGQTHGVEEAMWIALRALAESAAQARGLAQRMDSRGHERVARRFFAQADDIEQRGEVIRKTLLGFTERTSEPLDQTG